MMTSLAWVVLLTGSSHPLGRQRPCRAASADLEAPEGEYARPDQLRRQADPETPRSGPPATDRSAKIGIRRSHARYARPPGAEMRNSRGVRLARKLLPLDLDDLVSLGAARRDHLDLDALF